MQRRSKQWRLQWRTHLNLGFFRPDPAAEYHGVEAVRCVDWVNRILQSHDVVRGSSVAGLGIGCLMRIELKLATWLRFAFIKRATRLEVESDAYPASHHPGYVLTRDSKLRFHINIRSSAQLCGNIVTVSYEWTLRVLRIWGHGDWRVSENDKSQYAEARVLICDFFSAVSTVQISNCGPKARFCKGCAHDFVKRTFTENFTCETIETINICGFPFSLTGVDCVVYLLEHSIKLKNLLIWKTDWRENKKGPH